MGEFYSDEHQHKIEVYSCGYRNVNTYPWPYSDPDFASWPEISDPDSSTLVLDQSGFVVKHSTSYCAYKIFEATGKWPKASRTYRWFLRTSAKLPGERNDGKFEAKDWVQFLDEAGYNRVLSPTQLTNDFRCVGIDPNKGESGMVVWFESIRYGEVTRGKFVEYSTYLNGKYVYESFGEPQNFTWVAIC